VRTQLTDKRCGALERFSNTYILTGSDAGGFFLMKKPLGSMVPVYSNWRIAIVAEILSIEKHNEAILRCLNGDLRWLGMENRLARFSM
jgi:hypothetical protein